MHGLLLSCPRSASPHLTLPHCLCGTPLGFSFGTRCLSYIRLHRVSPQVLLLHPPLACSFPCNLVPVLLSIEHPHLLSVYLSSHVPLRLHSTCRPAHHLRSSRLDPDLLPRACLVQIRQSCFSKAPETWVLTLKLSRQLTARTPACSASAAQYADKVAKTMPTEFRGPNFRKPHGTRHACANAARSWAAICVAGRHQGDSDFI